MSINQCLKDYLTKFNINSPTFVKINDDLVHVSNVPPYYLDYMVDRLELIPCGGVIYLEEKENDR